MKFTNPFKKKDIIDKASIIKCLDKDTIRVSYKNIHGDEESCHLKNFRVEPRSTGDVKDINRLYLYEGGNLKYIIRITSNQLVYWQLDLGKENSIVSIDKEFIDEILDELV